MQTIGFEDFLAETRAARYDDYGARPGAAVRDADAFREMQAHLLARYAGLRAVRSLIVENDTFDCVIAMEAQMSAPADDEGCPEGSIPMRRITLEELTRFQTLGDYLGKRAGSYPR